MNKLFFLLLLLSPSAFGQDTPDQEGTIYEDTPVVEEIPLEEAPVDTVSPSESPVTEEPQDPSDTIIQDVAPEQDASVAPEVVPVPDAPVAQDIPVVDRGSLPTLSMDLRIAEDDHNPYESHWLTTFGFEGMQYEVPYEFTGAKKNFRPGDQELWGGRLGFGGELYLGAGFMTTTKVEGYYVGTLFARRLNAGPDESTEEVAFTKATGQVYGADVSQSISYVFDMKTKNPFLDEWTHLTVEPFIEAGVGKAWAYNRVNYQYDTGPAGTEENYRMRVVDDLMATKFGGGVNFTANSGYFLYLKATVYNFDITKRKTEEFTRPNHGTGSTVEETLKNVTIDPVTVYALGGGYKF